MERKFVSYFGVFRFFEENFFFFFLYIIVLFFLFRGRALTLLILTKAPHCTAGLLYEQ